jgi:hypothetical protein
MHASYADDMTLRDARALYFDSNGFGADGGYNDAWVDFKLGPVPMPFPNTSGRVRALKFHDMHHVLTGYETTTRGEFEISAWEIGAGCKNMVTAWVINSGGLVAGVLSAPRRTFSAFVRGRRSRTLYGEPFEPLLDETVGDVRARFIGPSERATATDAVMFACAAVIGLVVGLAFMAVALPLVPVGLVATWIRRRQQARNSSGTETVGA